MVIRITNYLADEGIDTHLVMLSDNGVLSDEISSAVTPHTLDAARARSAPGKLWKTLRQLRPDVLFSSHARINFMTIGLRPLLPGRPRAVIREAANPIADMEIQDTTRVYKPLYKTLYPRADALICQSKHMVADFDILMGRRLDNITQIYNPARPDMIGLSKSSANNPFTRPAMHQILTCGSLTRRKGYDILIEALAPLQKSGVDFQLTLLGEGPEREALEALATSLGVKDRVHFNGQTMDNAKWYLHADLFVQPSRIEGLPNTVIESMACGTPVVASNCPGGTRELIRDGENGMLFESENTSALTETLSTMLDSIESHERDTVQESISHLHPEIIFPRIKAAVLGLDETN